MSIIKDFNVRLEERKGRAVIRFDADGGRTIEGERDRDGRIRWSKPESVPRTIKNVIAPQLFAEYDRKKWGIGPSAA